MLAWDSLHALYCIKMAGMTIYGYNLISLFLLRPADPDLKHTNVTDSDFYKPKYFFSNNKIPSIFNNTPGVNKVPYNFIFFISFKTSVPFGKPQKRPFFSGPTTKAFKPPPLGLVVIWNFFFSSAKNKKKMLTKVPFSLVVGP